jgi:radical SAM protein with 4Fe4S-binding SPASM domain
MGDSSAGEILSWDDLIYVADFFEGSGEKNLSLLGGEPTLHPHFVDFVSYLLERRFRINVFTNGILSPAKLAEASSHLLNAPVEALSFVCNMNHPSISKPEETARIEEFLSTFSRYTSPGYNIHKPHFDIGFLFDAIGRFGLKRHVRLGLAHPIPGEVNTCVMPNEMPAMIACLLGFLPTFHSLRVTPGFDCGFPLCLFTNEQIGMLYKANTQRLVFGCGPALDIGPDLSVWPCFPLSNFHKKSLFDFNTLRDMNAYYLDMHKKVRIEAGGIFEQCDVCRFRDGQLCSGGCLAHLVSKFRNEPSIRVDEVYA